MDYLVFEVCNDTKVIGENGLIKHMRIVNVGVMYLHFRDISSDRKYRRIHTTHNAPNLSECFDFYSGVIHLDRKWIFSEIASPQISVDIIPVGF